MANKHGLLNGGAPVPIAVPMAQLTIRLPEPVVVKLRDLALARRTSIAAVAAERIVASMSVDDDAADGG